MFKKITSLAIGIALALGIAAVAQVSVLASPAVPAGYDSTEYNRMVEILSQPSTEPGKTNAQILKANPSKPETWKGVEWAGSGTKHIVRIDWNGNDAFLSGKLDVSGFSSLKDLFLIEQGFTSLNVDGCKRLLYLGCIGGPRSPGINALNVKTNPELRYLNCNFNNIKSLDISKNTKLTDLFCASNKLTKLSVSKNKNLKHLNCSVNPITSLNIKNSAITELDAAETKLTSLNATSKALRTLNVRDTKLIKLYTSAAPNLRELYCSYTKLTGLNLSKNAKLTYLDCSSNKLNKLDVSKNAKLTVLDCGSNKLQKLDVSKNKKLTWLDCFDNKLISLDVSKNPSLTRLSFSFNKISKFTASKNQSFTYFMSGFNPIKELNVKIKGKTVSLKANGNGYVTVSYSSPEEFYAQAEPKPGAKLVSVTINGKKAVTGFLPEDDTEDGDPVYLLPTNKNCTIVANFK